MANYVLGIDPASVKGIGVDGTSCTSLPMCAWFAAKREAHSSDFIIPCSKGGGMDAAVHML